MIGNKRILISTVLLMTMNSASLMADGDKSFDIALINYNTGRYAKAFSYFRKAVKDGLKDENKKKVLEYAIKIMKDSRKDLDDIEKGEISVRKNPQDKRGIDYLAEKHLAFAMQLTDDKFYLMMVEPHLERVIELDPGNVTARVCLAEAYYSSMQYDKAVKICESIIAASQGLSQICKLAGDACIAMGDYDKARSFYAQIVSANKTAVLGYSDAQIKETEAVMRALPYTYKDINKLIKEGRLDEAEATLKKRMSLNPGDYVAITALGSIYQEQGDKKTALTLYSKAIKIAPDYPIAHLFLGKLYHINRSYDKAVKEFDIFKSKMRLLPAMDDNAKKAYANSLLYVAEVYFMLEDYPKAKSEIGEALKIDPNGQDACYSMGVYYYKCEMDKPEAYRYFKKVIDIDPSTSTAKNAKDAIDFIRNDFDSKVAPDFSFISQDQ